MKINELKQAIVDGKFDNTFNTLYFGIEVPKKRYLNALDKFVEIYKDSGEVRLFSAPGRTEIGGNHTDHQHGSVLAGSVDLDVIAVVSENNENVIRIKSQGYDMDTIDVLDLDKKEKEVGRAAALIRGVCKAVSDRGYTLKGFNAYTTSNVLKGSGLSSSAAFEVLVGNILNSVCCQNKIDNVELAKIGQFAEKEYFGKPCGLLDQMASSLGGITFADFKDPTNPLSNSLSFDLHKFGHTLCVVDTGGNHANLTGDYADITLECKAVSNALGVEFLRDADTKLFYSKLGEIRQKTNDRAVLRAIHFFNEQQRVYDEMDAIKKGDFDEFLRLVNESGNSSYKFLQNLYSTSLVTEQGLSLAIALTEKFLNGKGACRVHGGGFAGTIQCYIPNDMLADYKAYMEAVFGENSCCVLGIRPVGGTEVKM